MTSIVLPYPVSANRYWRSFVPRGKSRAIVVLSDEAKSYKSQAKREALIAGIRKPILGRVYLQVRLFPAMPKDAHVRMRKHGDAWDDTVRCIDLDNALKVTIDALKGVLYEDDAQVWKLEVDRMEPDGEARVVVSAWSLQMPAPRQAELLGAT